MSLLRLYSVFLTYSLVQCGVLILSPKRLEISSLQPFNEQTYQFINKSLDKPKIVSFRFGSGSIPAECEQLISERYTSYVPTVEYIPPNAIILNGSPEKNCERIRQKIERMSIETPGGAVQLLIHDPVRRERDVESTTQTEDTKESAADEPVLYDAKGKALLYSSRPLVLRVEDTPDLLLGPTSLVTMDMRDTYIRLSATVPVNDGKVLLRFRFPLENGYWQLKSVEVTDLNGRKNNLTISSEVFAPRNFSHRCGGETVFSNGSVSLALFDLQVQPDVDNGTFSDAYNCVPFTTGPIWSGLFVTSILMAGLTVGLTALGSIKTMDKFDNTKTKQLTITLMGE